MEIPEFLPVFTLYYIKTVPFITVPNQTLYQMHQVINYTPYQILNPETNLIAVNIDHETFVYKEGICNDQKSITICPNHLLQIKHSATTCAEALVTKDEKSSELCLKKNSND
jgi:hypothetical protein